jgi:YHS domain-containing protein
MDRGVTAGRIIIARISLRGGTMNKCISSRMFFFFAVAVILSIPACTKAGPASLINITDQGVAIKGYDPVAYFTDMKPVKGSPEFEYSWRGARWRFSSAAHREMFRADPVKYAPGYGGYCAYAVSQGKLADIDPDSWTIYESRLYLNLNKDVQKLWEKDKPGYIRKADENWPGVLRR